MAFTLTTLSAAVGINDTAVMLTSLTGLAVGDLFVIDKEVFKSVAPLPTAATVPVPVLRGQEGTANAAHVITAQVKLGKLTTNLAAGDWTQPVAGAASIALFPGAPGREILSYTAAGAITLPKIGNDMIAVLNSTVALAMTLANPSIAQDGSRLLVLANGKAAHTITYTAGFGNVGATADVVTMAAAQAQGVEYVACGGFWVGVGLNTAVAGAGATINGVGLA